MSGIIGEEICLVCHEEMQENENLITLPCRINGDSSPSANHKFHLSCIRPWLQRHPTCPTCRSSIAFAWRRDNVLLPPPQRPVNYTGVNRNRRNRQIVPVPTHYCMPGLSAGLTILERSRFIGIMRAIEEGLSTEYIIELIDIAIPPTLESYTSSRCIKYTIFWNIMNRFYSSHLNPVITHLIYTYDIKISFERFTSCLVNMVLCTDAIRALVHGLYNWYPDYEMFDITRLDRQRVIANILGNFSIGVLKTFAITIFEKYFEDATIDYRKKESALAFGKVIIDNCDRLFADRGAKDYIKSKFATITGIPDDLNY